MTNKAGHLVQYESFAEFLLVLTFERDLSVINYGSQPETFTFYDAEAGKKRVYTPDFIAWKKGGTEIHEVTRTERQMRPNIQQREVAAHKICEERNWQYIVHNEKNLPNGAEKVNLLFLFSYRPSSYYNQDIADKLHLALESKNNQKLNELVNNLAREFDLPVALIFSTMYHLVWHRHLMTDLDKLLLIDGLPDEQAFVWQAVK